MSPGEGDEQAQALGAARKVVRRFRLVYFGIGLLCVVAVIAGWLVRRWASGPCGDEDRLAFCAGPDRASVCVAGEVHSMRCQTPCRDDREGLCQSAVHPAIGEACVSAGASLLTMPDDRRCSEDGRQVLDCVGRRGVWQVLRTCGEREVCEPSAVFAGTGCKAAPQP